MAVQPFEARGDCYLTCRAALCGASSATRDSWQIPGGEGRPIRLAEPSLWEQTPSDIACPVRLNASISNSSCSDLQSSAIRPDFIAQFRPGFGETIAARQPTLAETQPALRETDPQSLTWDRKDHLADLTARSPPLAARDAVFAAFLHRRTLSVHGSHSTVPELIARAFSQRASVRRSFRPDL